MPFSIVTGGELNGWPAFPLADATLAVLPLPAYDPRPKRLAKFSLSDSFIPNSKPVYPGAFPDTFSVFALGLLLLQANQREPN
jgi:hypothetical protein